MQTPTMMIDSTLEKLLSPKQAKSPSNESESSATKTESESRTKTSEAEVRLVVRFIVEEHIVYKGKIEKVNQLESEELSRVVSRVAWDETKRSGISKSSEAIEVTKESSFYSAPEECDPANTTKEQPSSENSHSNSSSTIDISQDQVQAYNSPESESDQDVYIKTNPSLQTALLGESTPEDIAKQLQTVKYDLKTECDKKNEQFPNLVAAQESPNTDVVQQALTERSVTSLSRNQPDFSLSSNPIPESIDDTSEESQSIADTLNDCLDNVVRESRTSNDEVSDENPKLSDKVLRELEDSAILRPHSSRASNESSYEIEETNYTSCEFVKTMKDSPQERFVFETSMKDHHEEVVQVAHIGNDLNCLRKHEVASSSGKRKLTTEHGSGKRIRKANQKEQRSSNLKRGGTKISENSGSRRNSTSGRTATNVSLLSDNQHTRQIKVFAKWSDNCFYPGIILKRASADKKFVISFLDGAQKDIAEIDLIPLCNIEGKQVRVTIAKNYCYNALVHDQRPPVDDQPMFDVEYQQDGLVRKCVSWKDIFLTGEQGTPLINQGFKNSGASNFADVDLDNIIYDKRSRRIQEMEEFYFTSSSPHRTKTSVLL